MSHLRAGVFFLILGAALAQDTSNAWLTKGIHEFQNAHYSAAVAAFQKSATLDPRAVHPRLYLANAWMSQYIPGATSPENVEAANNAEHAFLAALELDPQNVMALDGLASLKYMEAQGAQVPEEKLKLLGEARGWYLKVVEADPARKEAHYSLGVIAWAVWYPAWNDARAKSGLRPADPGPLPDATVRAALRGRYGPTLTEGREHLEQALTLDPQYDDAMAYMNLLLRLSADLAGSRAEYSQMIAEADDWVQRALNTRNEKAAAREVNPIGPSSVGNPAPPPPPVNVSAEQASPAPQRITIGAAVAESTLVYRERPVYPEDARQARIEGDVELRIVIGKDGRVQQLKTLSGHPKLVPAAMEAVRQWRYQPTLLNGEPIEVVTTVEVKFTLDTLHAPAASNAPGAPPEPPAQQKRRPPRITVASTVVQRKLIYQPRPTYPRDAKQAGIEGDVVLTAVIATDGSVARLDVQGGPPELAPAALEAVRQWKYEPTLINGQPVEVVTSIHVSFVLDKSK